VERRRDGTGKTNRSRYGGSHEGSGHGAHLNAALVKAALKNKEIDKRAPLTDAEALQVFSTMINQRKDSIEQFQKGNRPELAAREAREIVIIESYLPKPAGEEELKKLVEETLAGATLDLGTWVRR